MESDSDKRVVRVVDCNGRECDFCLEDIRRTSAAFWNSFTLSTERWVDRLVHFANGDRFLAMSLVLQTPLVLIIGNQWVGLLRFQKQDALVMLALDDAVVPRSPDSYGYRVDDALIHMAMCFGQGVTLPGDIIGLYVWEPTPTVRRWFRRLFVETAPDNRLVQEAWEPRTHPVVRRGLVFLHRITGGASSGVLDRLLSMEVHCTTPEQDALVTQCRQAAGIVEMNRPMKQSNVKIQDHVGHWNFKWQNVSVTFGNERVYERPDERLRWLAIWIVCTFSSRRGFEHILLHTPDALLLALLPAIKRASIRASHANDDGQANAVCRGDRRQRKRKECQAT